MVATTPRQPLTLSPFCPAFTEAIEIIGRRWTGAVIRSMLSGATRYSEMLSAVPGLSDRLLSERLKELEAEGIVEREVLDEQPVGVEYRLTPKGEALEPAVTALKQWARDWHPC